MAEPFSPEQRESIAQRDEVLFETIQFVARELGALAVLLLRKGFITRDELDYTIKEIETSVEVEKVLDPQRAARLEKLKKFFRGED